MKNKNIFFASLLCLGSMANIQADVAMQAEDSLKTSVELTQGYRNDELKFKSSNNGRKLKFKNVDTYTTRLGVMVQKDDLFMTGLAGYGNVYSGNKVHGRKVKGDYTADFAVNFGKNFAMENDWTVAPTVGYGVYIQDFHTKSHNGDRSKVKATWYSPQIGVSVKKTFNEEWNAFLSYNFLYPLSAQVSSNTKSSGTSRRQNQAYKSVGNIGSIGAEWTFAKNWSLKPEIEVMKFYSNGGNSSNGRHNKASVDRSSVEYRIALNYMF